MITHALNNSKEAFPFQVEGLEFIKNSDYRCLIADAMGLGKTVQALLSIRNAREILTPTLIIVKSATTFQWCNESHVWLDSHPLSIMPILDRNQIIPGFQFYTISQDFLARKGVLDRVKKLGIKCVIVDECQAYKDPWAKRTEALKTLVTDQEIKYIIALSGYPIKNRASEFFSILNLLRPEKFPSLEKFKRDWLSYDNRTIASCWLPHWVKETQSFILRRERQDVLTELPKLTRNFTIVSIEDPVFKDLYNQEIDLFQNFLNADGRVNSKELLGWLAKMRAITGQAKVEWAMNYIQEVMDTTEDSLAIGTQHNSVRDTLYLACKALGYEPLKLSGEDSAIEKSRIQEAFNTKKNRLLIINMLAGGVGLNLQAACHKFVVLERLWNAPDELQFESRFYRYGQQFPCEAIYPLARNTIDIFMHELNARKRRDVTNTLQDDSAEVLEALETDQNALMALAEKVVESKI